MTKKKWEKPELIVLFRGKPEQAVLAACKGHMQLGPQVSEAGCTFMVVSHTGTCKVLVGS